MRYALALLLLTLAACATAPEGDRRARASAQAVREEGALAQSPIVEDDPALNAYARQVLCKVAQECGPIRLYLMRSPDFGARTLENGAIEVGVGLMWRSANEAQFAFVLSRQAAHLAEGHPGESTAAEARLDNVRLTIGALSLLAPPFLDDLFQLGVNAVGINAGQSRERVADALALERMAAAGYDPAEAVALSSALQAESRAGRHVPPSLREDSDLNRAAPTSRGRLRAIARDAAAAAPIDAEAHRRQVRPFLAEWLEADLRRRDYDASLYAFERLASSSSDPGVVNYYIGQAYRMRREEGDLERAREAYRLAASFPDTPAVAWREHGEAEARAGETETAITALRMYLTRAANAPDRALIDARIAELQQP